MNINEKRTNNKFKTIDLLLINTSVSILNDGIMFKSKINLNIFKIDNALASFINPSSLGIKETATNNAAEDIEASIIILLLVKTKNNNGFIELFLILIGYVIHLNK